MIPDMIALTIMSLILGIFLLCMGLSFISESLDSLSYDDTPMVLGGKTAHNYYRNPLWHYQSKYFHYRPKGTIIVSKDAWGKVERGIKSKVKLALGVGKKAGYKEAVEDIKDRVDQRRQDVEPSNAYMALGVTAKASEEEVDKAMRALLDKYDPAIFTARGYDESFVRLAEIKAEQIMKAYKQITKTLKGSF